MRSIGWRAGCGSHCLTVSLLRGWSRENVTGGAVGPGKRHTGASYAYFESQEALSQSWSRGCIAACSGPICKIKPGLSVQAFIEISLFHVSQLLAMSSDQQLLRRQAIQAGITSTSHLKGLPALSGTVRVPYAELEGQPVYLRFTLPPLYPTAAPNLQVLPSPHPYNRPQSCRGPGVMGHCCSGETPGL